MKKGLKWPLFEDESSLFVLRIERVNASDFAGLKLLQSLTEKDFVCGIVLYAGSSVVSFGEKLFAIPFDALWH